MRAPILVWTNDLDYELNDDRIIGIVSALANKDGAVLVGMPVGDPQKRQLGG